MEKSIESKTANCILEISHDTVKIAGEEYLIPQPTPATLIMISELVSQMPAIDGRTDSVVYEILGKAKDLSVIGDIAATLILGAKRVKERREKTITHVVETERWSWKKFRFVTDRTETVDRMPELEYLSKKILEELSNADMLRLISDRLHNMQIGDFFVLTTSLSEANLLKRTKEVETASGE